MHTHTKYTVYTHCPSIISTALHKRYTKVLTHLSTESKVFLSGGGRALTFLGAGPSLSVCGGGRLSSVANGGGRGEEGRDSFHPACTESSIYATSVTEMLWVDNNLLFIMLELKASVWCSSHLFGGSAFPVPCVRGVRCTGALQGSVKGRRLLGRMCWWRLRIKGEMTSGCCFSLPLLFPLSFSLPIPLPFSLFSSASSFVAAHRDVCHRCLHLMRGPDWKLG